MSIENPNHEPQTKKLDYMSRMPELIGEAQAAPDSVERKAVVRSLLDGVIKDAESGVLKSDRRGDSYSADEVRSMFKSFYDVYNKPTSSLSSRFQELRERGQESRTVTSAGGLRAVFEKLSGIDGLSQDLFEAILEEQNEHALEMQKVGGQAAEAAGIRLLAVNNQPGLITEIPAHIRNSSQKSEVATPAPESARSVSDRLNDLTANLSAEQKSLLLYYATAVYEKGRAQKDGRGDDSIYWGQQMGQYRLQMTPAVQRISSQYASLYNSQEQL